MRKNKFFSLGLFLLLFVGCNKQQDIVTYRVAKEEVAPLLSNEKRAMSAPPALPSNPMLPPAPSTSGEIHWTLPSSWKELAPSAMRVGSFLAHGKNGQPIDISVVALSGQAGGDLANVNRWRGQINLEPIADQELNSVSQSIAAGGKKMVLVDFSSSELLIDNKFKKRLIAVTYNGPEKTWFFKMTGESSAVGDVKKEFLKFLEGLNFNEHE